MNSITIARQYGSGGREIGLAISKQLNIPYYDKQLIALAAKKSGMSEEIFQKADERHASSLLYSLVMGNYSFGVAGGGPGDLPINDQLFLLQMEIIKEAAKKGPCVFVGRCADYVLREYPHIFRVFLYADKDFRRTRAIQEYGQSPDKVDAFMAKKDKQRAGYYNFYTSAKWGDPANYDLCLNTSSMGIQGAVEVLIHASGYKTK